MSEQKTSIESINLTVKMFVVAYSCMFFLFLAHKALLSELQSSNKKADPGCGVTHVITLHLLALANNTSSPPAYMICILPINMQSDKTADKI